jgi:hypothetical protein
MKSLVVVLVLLSLAACQDSALPEHYSACRQVADQVALDATTVESPSALTLFDDEEEKSQAKERARSELEAQRTVFVTAMHEQRMALALMKTNRFAERYLQAYAHCRKIDAGQD